MGKRRIRPRAGARRTASARPWTVVRYAPIG